MISIQIPCTDDKKGICNDDSLKSFLVLLWCVMLALLFPEVYPTGTGPQKRLSSIVGQKFIFMK